MSSRSTGIALAFVTACISGVSIWVNSPAHALSHFPDSTVFTTAKNLVAGVVLLLILLVPGSHGKASVSSIARRRWPALLAVAVIGGSVPFVLFFDGLKDSTATQAAFIQKSLIIWVALLAVPLLKERFGWPHALAIVFLVVGQAWLAGLFSAGTRGHVAFGKGEAMILVATLFWSVEIVFVKYLLRTIPPSVVAAARMAVGSVLLVCWLALTGKLGDLTGLSALQWRWVLLTGLLLSAYVATWFAALARAQAIDVTAVLVFGALVTAILSGVIDGAAIGVGGTVLVAIGSGVIAWAALRRPPREAVT
jgi:drug/metabolite transporter (DMT)-like permease